LPVRSTGAAEGRGHRRLAAVPEPVDAAAARPPGDEVLLRVADLSVSFGGVEALTGVDLVITRGSLHGIIGPNGAGKSTLIDAITGFERPTHGSIVFMGVEVGRVPAHSRARRGLSRTLQSLELYLELTVRENLDAAAHASKRCTPEWFDHVVATLELGPELPLKARDLSHGRRRIVSLGRALVTHPELLILDEPAAGLDTHETEALARQLRVIVADGVTVALVDHDMSLVMGESHKVTVLEEGAVLAEGTPSEIVANADVRRVYLGSVG
jgi:branched-chain amino acid transport system ATP-binding protein